MAKVCIECGHRLPQDVTQLYHEKLFKKTKILKLLQCEKCDEVCDKYVEYEGTLLLLDVALQRKPALRHLLINEDHSSTILKVTLLTLIIDGYCRWSETGGRQQFFEQEFEFYTKFAESFSSLAIYLTVTLLTIISCCQVKTSLPRLVTGLLLSFCTRFLMLGALLWVTGPETRFLWSAVELLSVLTSVSVTRVLTDTVSLRCWAIMLTAHMARLSSHNISQIMSNDVTQSVLCL